MGRTVIPPHTANERTCVHMSAEAAMYVIQGDDGPVYRAEANR